MNNPIEESRTWLVECGYSETEAENLLRAIKADSPEKLWEIAPKWIEHVGWMRKKIATTCSCAGWPQA